MASALDNSSGRPACFRLFDLPPELQDIVFAYAFQKAKKSHLVFKRVWAEKEVKSRKKDRAVFVPRPFSQQPKVDQWMVSRQFFLSAARAWMRSLRSGHTLGSNKVEEMHSHFALDRDGLYEDYVVRASYEIFYYILTLQRWPNLQHVTLAVEEGERPRQDGAPVTFACTWVTVTPKPDSASVEVLNKVS